jgi:hypothetical protein
MSFAIKHVSIAITNFGKSVQRPLSEPKLETESVLSNLFSQSPIFVDFLSSRINYSCLTFLHPFFPSPAALIDNSYVAALA